MASVYEAGRFTPRHFNCYLLLLVGLAAFCVSAWIDVDYWTSIAKTERAKWEWGAASIVFQLMVLAFAGFVGLNIRSRSWLAVFLGGVILSCYTLYNVGSVIGFGARERIEPARTAMVNQQRRDDAVAEQNALQMSLRTKYIEELRSKVEAADKKLLGNLTTKQREELRAQREADERARGEAYFKDVEVKISDVDTAMVDPQAATLAAIFTFLTLEAAQIIVNAAFGIGIVFAKMFCWTAAFAYWPAPRILATQTLRREDAPDTPANENVEGDDEDDDPVPSPSPKEPGPPPPAVAEPVSVIDLGNLSEVTANQLETAKKDQNALQWVGRFFDEATRPALGNRLRSTSVLAHYNKWAEALGGPHLASTGFGRFSTDLRINKDRGSRSYAYLDIELVPLELALRRAPRARAA
jgi:hypothetical protein